MSMKYTSTTKGFLRLFFFNRKVSIIEEIINLMDIVKRIFPSFPTVPLSRNVTK